MSIIIKTSTDIFPEVLKLNPPLHVSGVVVGGQVFTSEDVLLLNRTRCMFLKVK